MIESGRKGGSGVEETKQRKQLEKSQKRLLWGFSLEKERGFGERHGDGSL